MLGEGQLRGGEILAVDQVKAFVTKRKVIKSFQLEISCEIRFKL